VGALSVPVAALPDGEAGGGQLADEPVDAALPRAGRPAGVGHRGRSLRRMREGGLCEGRKKQGGPERTGMFPAPDRVERSLPPGLTELGDGRALRLTSIPSAAQPPPTFRLKAWSFASPAFARFALSRMKGVPIRA